MKGLKIFNIILFSLICALEVALVYIFAESLIMILSNNVGEMLISILFFFPYFLLLVGILFVLAIIITITTKVRIKKLSEQNLERTKFDKICTVLPWVFLIINVVLYALFFIIAKLK